MDRGIIWSTAVQEALRADLQTTEPERWNTGTCTEKNFPGELCIYDPSLQIFNIISI